jgi:hypothetical protein
MAAWGQRRNGNKSKSNIRILYGPLLTTRQKVRKEIACRGERRVGEYRRYEYIASVIFILYIKYEIINIVALYIKHK